MKLFGYLFAPVAVMALALVSSEAQAASIVQTDVLGPTQTDWGPTAFTPAFNQFDPSLGTLTSVVVAISATGSMSGTVTNNGELAQSFSVTETSTLSIGAFPDSALSTFSPVLTGTQSYASLASGGSAPFGPFSPSDNSQGQTFTSPTDLADFTGLGTFSVNGSRLLPRSTALSSGGMCNETGVSFTGTTVVGAYSVTVTYSFLAARLPNRRAFCSPALAPPGWPGWLTADTRTNLIFRSSSNRSGPALGRFFFACRATQNCPETREPKTRSSSQRNRLRTASRDGVSGAKASRAVSAGEPGPLSNANLARSCRSPASATLVN